MGLFSGFLTGGMGLFCGFVVEVGVFFCVGLFCEFFVVFVGFVVICVDRCGLLVLKWVLFFIFFKDFSNLLWWLLVLPILGLWGCQ